VKNDKTKETKTVFILGAGISVEAKAPPKRS